MSEEPVRPQEDQPIDEGWTQVAEQMHEWHPDLQEHARRQLAKHGLEHLVEIAGSAPSVHDVLKVVKHTRFDRYWNEFAEIGNDKDVTTASLEAASKSGGLLRRLVNPQNSSGYEAADRVRSNKIASEWYLGLGGLNSLQGCAGYLSLAAASLWFSQENESHDHVDRRKQFLEEISSISLDDIDAVHLPKRWEKNIDDPEALDRLGMVGQILLDIPRAASLDGNVDLKSLRVALKRSYFVNLAIVNGLKNKEGELSVRQSRALSDALKAKYDSQFDELQLLLGKERIDEDKYDKNYVIILRRQLEETIAIAGGEISNDKIVDLENFQDIRDNSITGDHDHIRSKMKRSKFKSPGDLFENYFNVLMRYTLNVAPEERRFIVQTATRRQDEPHTGFTSEKGLPNYAFDAKIIDSEGLIYDKVVQLKTHEDNQNYAPGIIVLDKVLTSDDRDLAGQRSEMLEGMGALLGLCKEVYVRGYSSSFNQVKLNRHQRNVEAQLESEGVREFALPQLAY